MEDDEIDVTEVVRLRVGDTSRLRALSRRMTDKNTIILTKFRIPGRSLSEVDMIIYYRPRQERIC